MQILSLIFILLAVLSHKGSVDDAVAGQVLDRHKPVILVIPCTTWGQNKFGEALINELRYSGLQLEAVSCLNKNPDIARDDMARITEYALDNDISQILRIQYLNRRIPTSDPVFDSEDFSGQLTVSLHTPKTGSLFVSGEPAFMFTVSSWRSLIQKLEKKLEK